MIREIELLNYSDSSGSARKLGQQIVRASAAELIALKKLASGGRQQRLLRMQPRVLFPSR